MITTPGQILVDDALPAQYRQEGRILDGKELSALMTQMARELPPSEYVETLQKLNNTGRRVATEHGRSASIHLTDLDLPPAIMKLRDELKLKVKKIQNSDTLTPADKNAKIIDMVDKATSGIDEDLYKETLKTDNAFAQQIKGGFRGKKFQLRQMLLGTLLSTDSRGKTISYPGLESYADGVSPMSYWSALHGSRKGYVAIQQSTADVGYLGRQVTNIAHRQIITSPDCGVDGPGLTVDGDDRDNVGALLAQDIGPLKKNSIITDDVLPALAGKKILVRSPITCKMDDGVCAKCAGLRETGRLPIMGDAVGINAVRSFLEPLTQSAIGSKHSAGEKKSSLQQMSGFRQVNQFLQSPDEFAGGAILAHADGAVAGIEKAPQGGHNILVGGEKHHVPEGYEIKVKVGDKMEAGDMMTDGMVNPRELVQYKGIGDGRKYFLEHFRKILQDGNASTNRRNLELLSRAFVSKVRVTDPEGYDGQLPDDIIDYDALAANWQPREGSKLKTLESANTLYMEQPYLHYSVGTRITPGVIGNLRKSGIGSVLAHPEPPPFEAEVVRARDFVQHDKDWLTRLSGENLKRGAVQMATRGATSEKKSTSYYPTLVNIHELNTNNDSEE